MQLKFHFIISAINQQQQLEWIVFSNLMHCKRRISKIYCAEFTWSGKVLDKTFPTGILFETTWVYDGVWTGKCFLFLLYKGFYGWLKIVCSLHWFGVSTFLFLSGSGYTMFAGHLIFIIDIILRLNQYPFICIDYE